MQQSNVRIPLLEKLDQYVQADPVRFHVPGHKGLSSFLHPLAEPYYSSLLSIDVTELSGLDDLHAPQSVIKEAERLAATFFQAEETFFLINGSTVGNLAMILGSLDRGAQVFVQRNSHKSIFHALTMLEAEAIFLEPSICPNFGVPIGISTEQFGAALNQFPQAKAVILTYPNYYGMAAPIQEMIALAHEHDMLVLVDEAHGAHFGLHEALPPSAMQLGADLSVQSTHKMLGSLTQTSMLHVQGSRVNRADLAYYLQSLQSSSPSYPLMASLDLARAQAKSITPREWQQTIAAYIDLGRELEQLSSFYISGVDEASGAGEFNGDIQGMVQDPFKLIIQPRKLSLSGYQLQQALEAEGIFVELADPLNVLLTLPLVVQEEWNQRLVQALATIQEQEHHRRDTDNDTKDKYLQFIKEYELNRSEEQRFTSVQMGMIRHEQKEQLPLNQALGRVAAEMITPYPPGIPILFPGQTISQEIMEQILFLEHFGASFQGRGNKVGHISVKKRM